VSTIWLATVGAVDAAIVRFLEEALGRSLGIGIACHAGMPEAAYAWDPARRQFSSSPILSSLAEARPYEALRLLGLTESDLFIPMLSFVYGQAQLGGGAALLSLARLRQEFYGMPAAPDLLAERVHKEALHELGHTFGLVHCQDKGCAMALSTNIRQVDLKNAYYCADCRALVEESMRREDAVAEGGR
jgi:archaemetzincin